jgi:hypothetical protein
LSGYVTNHTGAATNLALTGGSVTTQTNTDLTASRVVVSSASKVLASSSVTSTTLGYLDATSSVQTQLDSKPTVALTNVAQLNQTNNLTAANTITNSGNTISAASYGSAQQTLTYSTGTNITVDASKALHFVTLTNATYFTQPSNLQVGASFTILLRQDSTGVRSVTFDTNYWKFPSGSAPTITTNALAYDVLSCVASPYGTNIFTIQAANFR